MATHHYVIKGADPKSAADGSKPTPIRREIDEWWFSSKKEDVLQQTLMVRALQKFMAADPSNDLSYFGIAGIHGQPLKPWDNVTGKEVKSTWYCTHASILFPPWHRPYLLLYEQAIYENMQSIIPEFAAKDQADLKAAAANWRLPFWDWAMKKPNWTHPEDLNNYGCNAPYLITVPKVTVMAKSGSGTEDLDNPFFRFALPSDKLGKKKPTFGDLGVQQDDEGYAIADTTSTVRHCGLTRPRPKDLSKQNPTELQYWLQGDFREDQWKSIMNALRGSDGSINTLPERVYRLFSKGITWKFFATGQYNSNQGTFDSLESIHNNLHTLAGGMGHLSYPAVAAFDPLFWLHHNNVDRLFAIYQAVHSEAADPGDGGAAYYAQTYKDPRTGLTVGPLDGLAPFSKDAKGTLWNSTDCQDTFKLNYTYPELQKWKFTSGGTLQAKEYRASINRAIDSKYSTTAKAVLTLPENAELAKRHLLSLNTGNLAVEHFPTLLMDQAQSLLGAPAPPAAVAPTLVSAPESWSTPDYVVNVLFDRFALRGGLPYTVRIFLGAVPTGSLLDLGRTPTQIGIVYNFASPVEGRGLDATGCANCQAQRAAGVLETGQVILTDHLAQRVAAGADGLASLDVADVVPYLKRNLHWRVTARGQPVALEELPALKVGVAVGRATHFRSGATLSTYEVHRPLWEVTEGMVAGARPGDF